MADHRLGAALGDVARRPHDRGLGLGANRGNRVLLVADRVRARHDLDPVDAVEAQLGRRAEDADPDPVGGGQPRALGEGVEALLGAEAVEGDGHAAPPGSGITPGSRGRPSSGSATECEITSRPA